jgi:3-keto-5-aminohexanoate cleavage enzyme
MKKKPLVIVATPNICWLNPDVKYPRETPEIIEEAVLCREAGAAVLHTHAEGRWKDVICGVRERSDIIIQSGMSSIPLQERIELFEEKSDMVSIIASHHAEAFAQVNCDVLHPLAELREYCAACRKYGVKPEWEIWHSGSIWNLRRLIEEGLLDPPYITTFFLGWPGGTWSPPTVQEYLYRRSLMPEDCVITVSIMCEEQMDILAAAITQGDNVRVGTEDWPCLQNGKIAATHELVKEIADISRSLGREAASPSIAREMMGI